jgi:nitroreductase
MGDRFATRSGSTMAAHAPTERVEPSLPPPNRERSALFRLLSGRRSFREFADRDIELQTLADLLWAAFGVSNREGYRTAPSARNWREIDVFVALRSGLFRYDAADGQLVRVLNDDVRGLTGLQEYVALAPVNLVYVAKFARMGGASEREKEFYAAADSGAIAENVYLACADLKLVTVVRGLIDRTALARRMRLQPDERITLAQSIGYPGT